MHHSRPSAHIATPCLRKEAYYCEKLLDEAMLTSDFLCTPSIYSVVAPLAPYRSRHD